KQVSKKSSDDYTGFLPVSRMYGRERDGLAPASFGFIRIALGNFQVTLNISAWYAGIGLAPLVAMLALAADGICDVIKKVTLPRFPALGIVHKRRNAVIALLSWWQLRNQALAQVFVEKFESARPRQFRRLLVITRRRVVVETVLFALVHVQCVRLVVGLERRFICRDAGVDALVIACVMKQQRRGNLGDIICARLAAIERDPGIQIGAQPHS